MAEIQHQNVSLFQPRRVEMATEKVSWTQYRPSNQWTEGSVIEFNIDGSSTSYLDLSQTLLYVKLKIVKTDGTAIVKGTDKVGLTNAPLHTLFSQIDLKIQQHPVSEIGNNYAYKGYLDTLLNTVDEHELHSQLFITDEGGKDMVNPDSTGPNVGLYRRALYTHEGQEVDLIGHLALDLCQQDRALLNGVPVHIKLWQNADTFRLMSTDSGYHVKITDTFLKVAMVKVNPAVILSQTEVLKDSPALYPYTKSVIKTYAMSKGQYSFATDDLFQSQLPQQVTVGIVSSAGHHGSYAKNPYNFENVNCNYVGFFVDGQSVPTDPLQPNYKGNSFMEAYDRLGANGKQRAVHIPRNWFHEGYCLYVFNIDGDLSDREDQRGHTRLELKFTEALAEPYTVIVYAKFPALMKIDQHRNVTLE